MNLILFEPQEISRPLPRSDARARHLLEVLHRNIGDTFDAGLIDGPRGKGTLTAITTTTVSLTFVWGERPDPADPITLIIGLPRPQTARDILRDATTLGTRAIHFIKTDKGDPNYAQSSLWRDNEWRRHILLGAEQAFDTRLPSVTHGHTLTDAIATLTPDTICLALDNYESPSSLGEYPLDRARGVCLALGPERGWSAGERNFLRAHAFAFAHLGSRVLRAETACIAALSLVRFKLGLM